MQLLGALLIIWGIIDFAMDKGGTDVYYDWFGVYLPDWLYNYSPWIAVMIGVVLVRTGNENAKK
jgi:hypothetical protein